MKTVLLVEDDPKNVRVMTKFLTHLGKLTVKHTEDAEEVIQIVQARAADIVLMDVSLARSVYQGKPVDGIQITQILKQDPATASVPVILVTAHAMEGHRENFLQKSGADGYVSKPIIDYQALIDQIMALLPQT